LISARPFLSFANTANKSINLTYQDDSYVEKTEEGVFVGINPLICMTHLYKSSSG
jgi:hypothetical protein